MPKYTVTFDFSLFAWIQNVEIEADDIEEAKEKLNKMSLEELVEEGYVKDFNIKDLDYSVEDNDL